MKLAINSLSSISGHVGRGIGFYTTNLLIELRKIQDLEIIEFGNVQEIKQVDVVHYPSFDFFFPTLPIKKKYPTVLTIHDVTPLKFPQHYPPGIKGSINLFRQKMALKNVDAVITDSNTSKKEISQYLSIKEDKIHVVYLGVSKDFKVLTSEKTAKVKKKYQLSDQFLLFTGNVNWNKNLLNLAEAALKANMPLVLIGKSFEKRDGLEHAEFASYKTFLDKYSRNELIKILGFIETEELIAIYNLSTITLFPSFAEGFGLPILESQACGTPVITSNLSSMPEVAGEGALLIDPYNVDEIVAAIRKIQTEPKVRKELISKGFENIKRFSWEKCAEETYDVYQKVVSEVKGLS